MMRNICSSSVAAGGTYIPNTLAAVIVLAGRTTKPNKRNLFETGSPLNFLAFQKSLFGWLMYRARFRAEITNMHAAIATTICKSFFTAAPTAAVMAAIALRVSKMLISRLFKLEACGGL